MLTFYKNANYNLMRENACKILLNIVFADKKLINLTVWAN